MAKIMTHEATWSIGIYLFPNPSFIYNFSMGFNSNSNSKKLYCILFYSYTLHTIGIRHIISIASNLSKVTLDNNIITCKVSGFKGGQKLTRVSGPLDWLTNDSLSWEAKGTGKEQKNKQIRATYNIKFSDKVIIIIQASVAIAWSNMPWFYVWYSNSRLNTHLFFCTSWII